MVVCKGATSRTAKLQRSRFRAGTRRLFAAKMTLRCCMFQTATKSRKCLRLWIIIQIGISCFLGLHLVSIPRRRLLCLRTLRSGACTRNKRTPISYQNSGCANWQVCRLRFFRTTSISCLRHSTRLTASTRRGFTRPTHQATSRQNECLCCQIASAAAFCSRKTRTRVT